MTARHTQSEARCTSLGTPHHAHCHRNRNLPCCPAQTRPVLPLPMLPCASGLQGDHRAGTHSMMAKAGQKAPVHLALVTGASVFHCAACFSKILGRTSERNVPAEGKPWPRQ